MNEAIDEGGASLKYPTEKDELARSSGNAWQVWHSSATNHSADVFLRWTDASPGPDEPFEATLRGPFCTVARTLPASFTFRRVEAGLWRTTVVDPCFWSPDFPAYYQLHGCLQDPQSAWVTVGIRQWGTRGAHFWLNGNRWVWRAANVSRTTSDSKAWHELLLSKLFVIDDQDMTRQAEAIQEASLLGIAVGVRLASRQQLDRLRRFSNYPALLLASLPADEKVDRSELHHAAPNVVFLAEFGNASTLGRPAWCDGVIGPDDAAWLARFREHHAAVPLVARRVLTENFTTVASTRQACEQLQRDLIQSIDASGYILEYLP